MLVVEDDADLRYLFRISLAVAGFDVRVAADGIQARREDQPDAVVLIRLPRVSGFTSQRSPPAGTSATCPLSS